jgi:hypothetical protein
MSSPQIVYRATVQGVSCVDVTIEIKPAEDGEEPLTKSGDGWAVNVPGATNAEDVGDLLRAFGALIGVEGAVRVTIEPVRQPPESGASLAARLGYQPHGGTPGK